MFRLRTGYLISGLITGILLLFSYVTTLPDGKLHIIFCNVGQGDAVYIRFPDGKDALIDGGPGNQVLNCLGKHMPFWDRTIDLVILTHPENDHLGGLVQVLERYRTGYFVRSGVFNDSEGYRKLMELVAAKKIAERKVYAGEKIGIGTVNLSVLWPTRRQIALMVPPSGNPKPDSDVFGAVAPANLNDASVVIRLSYGNFDALFPGDADTHVDGDLAYNIPADPDGLEVLKVPHHGSGTGMTDAIINVLSPPGEVGNKCNSLVLQSGSEAKRFAADICPLAVISVGKNSYGHPAAEIIGKLKAKGFRVLRTDESGDIEAISDGRSWNINTVESGAN